MADGKGPYVTSPIPVGPGPSPESPPQTIVVESDQPVGQPSQMAFTGQETFGLFEWAGILGAVGLPLVVVAAWWERRRRLA